MYVIITCKYEKDLIKKKWQHGFPHHKSMGIFSDAQGQLTLQSVVGSGRISNSFEHTCKYEKDRIKKTLKKQRRKRGNIDFLNDQGITLWSGVGSGRISNSSKLGIFPDAKGQRTLQSVVESRRISNSSELLCKSLLSASMKRIG